MKKLNVLLISLLSCSMMLGCSIGVDTDSNTIIESESPSDEPSPSETQTVESESPVAESESPSASPSEQPSEESDTIPMIPDEDFVFPERSASEPVVKEMSALPSYTPTTFKASSYSETTTVLADGVTQVKCNLTLNGTTNVTSAYVVEVDLSKADVKAGSYDNTLSLTEYTKKSVPTAQALAWERDNPGKKVLAVTNADYFAWGDTGVCVNAFAKEGVILKSEHVNDSGDVPVSAPMLFGMCSKGAKIAPMTNTGDHTKDYRSKLYYSNSLSVYTQEGEVRAALTDGKTNTTNDPNTYSFIDQIQTNKYYAVAGHVYKLRLITPENGQENHKYARVIEASNKTSMSSFRLQEEGYGYLTVGSNIKDEFQVGDFVDLENSYVDSEEGHVWAHFDTILGCRHSLVENGTIPSTVAQEYQNGAQARVPRSAVGVKPNGNVVIVSIEDVHYGNSSTYPTCTGMNLTQLADFMRYYGCYDAANFDGGGSSQLCTKKPTDGGFTVITRSSDYCTYSVNSTRKVLNSIMVTTK